MDQMMWYLGSQFCKSNYIESNYILTWVTLNHGVASTPFSRSDHNALISVELMELSKNSET